MDDDDRREQGMRIRREVLGDAYVDRASAGIDPGTADPGTADFQDFITRYAWGEVWARPGLDRRMRSVATVAVLTALDRPDELRMHLRAALRNGLTKEEVAEVLLHTAIYAGVPAANRAFALTREAWADDPVTDDPPADDPSAD
jgi:4-carboxymuconolactone decarboxylase